MRVKKATDPESREYWQFVERVAREGPCPVRCDVCGLPSHPRRVIYVRGKARLYDRHFRALNRKD